MGHLSAAAVVLVGATAVLLCPTTSPGAEGGGSRAPGASVGYVTRIESDSDDLLKLENGGVVEITSGYIGYVGYRKRAVVFRDGSSWRIWVEGKRVFRCDLLREPVSGRVSVEPVSVVSVSEEGDLLRLADRRVLEVSSLHTLYTQLWLPPFEALIIDDSELLNIDDDDEPVLVRTLR